MWYGVKEELRVHSQSPGEIFTQHCLLPSDFEFNSAFSRDISCISLIWWLIPSLPLGGSLGVDSLTWWLLCAARDLNTSGYM